MTKQKLAALEKVFAAEIYNQLPFQSKARIFKRLQDEGYLQPFRRQFKYRLGVVTVDGYQLTHAGRYLYCKSCEELEL
jgi:hypothetical protein